MAVRSIRGSLYVNTLFLSVVFFQCKGGKLASGNKDRERDTGVFQNMDGRVSLYVFLTVKSTGGVRS